MHRVLNRMAKVWLILATLLVLVSPVIAEISTDPNAKPDMRVLIDISGSMKKNDPENLRIPAVKLLLNLAPDDSRFGTWAFGQYVNNLIPVDTVSQQWKKGAVSKADGINSAGLFTNIGAALERAQGNLKAPDPEWDRTLVLLSDGMVDISKNPAENVAEKQRILNQIVPSLKQAGFKIHAVALSEQSDKEFLKALALLTDGRFSSAATADELLSVFVDASDQVNEPQQIPMEDNQFTIDEAVNEFTALIFHEPKARQTELVSPSGDVYSVAKGSRNISWFADSRYDLITVYNPEPGKWQARAELSPGNRVTIISDLTISMSGLPDNVLEGEQLTMELRLEENGRVISNPKFLRLLNITFSQETDSAEHFEGNLLDSTKPDNKIPADGVFSAKLGRTITQGKHKFEVVVDGKTFTRTKTKTMQVHREVLEVEAAYRDQEGQVLQYLLAKPKAGLIEPEKVQIMAQLVDPNGEKSIQNGVLNESGAWEIDVPPFGALGQYEVLLKLSGTSRHGKSFELFQGPFIVDYSPITNDISSNIESDGSPQDQSVEEESSKDEGAIDHQIIESIDPALAEIPSLEVEELPPEDLVIDSSPPIPEDVEISSEADSEVMTDSKEEETSWILVTAIILANLGIIGGGIFFYLRFLRKADQEQSQVVEEITQIQEQRKGKTAALNATPDSALDPVSEPIPETKSMDAAPPAADLSEEEDDATIMRGQVSADGLKPESSIDQAEKLEDLVPEKAYVNDAAPMELEEESTIEIDDGFDDDLDVMEGMDELDMMLSEQEDDQILENDEQLNQTIDEMLEQPTVFPEQKAPSKQGEQKQKRKSEKDTDFDDDEFMLDDPNKQ